jgi:hypothetical protein
MDIIQEVENLIVEANAISLRQLKKDLRTINIDGYFIRCSYNEKKFVCTFTMQQVTDDMQVFPSEDNAIMKAKTLLPMMNDFADAIEKISPDYNGIANMIKINKQATANISRPKGTSPDLVTNKQYYPAVVSTFDKYLNIGDN